MPLGTILAAFPVYDGGGQHNWQARTKWIDAVSAGGSLAANNSGNRVSNPSQIGASATGAYHRKLIAPPSAVGVLLRVGYADGTTMTTDPVVQVFGFDDQADDAACITLYNTAGTPVDEVTLADAANDISDGTLEYSLITSSTYFPLLGSNVILVGIKTAAASAGDLTIAKIQAKFV